MTFADFSLPMAQHPLVETLGWVLLHFLWQGALVAGALALALTLMHRRPAAERYAVSLAALALMAALPVLTWQVQSPAREAFASEAHPSHSFSASAKALEMRAPEGRVVIFRSVPAAEARRGPQPEASAAKGLFLWAQRHADRSAPLVALGWLLGVAVLALRTAGGWAYTMRLRRDATPPTERWQQRFTALVREMNLASLAPKLRICGRMEGPAAVGWWRPAVLVPTGFLTGLPPEQVEAILRHELAHIRRHDYLVGLAQAGVETLLFYHPAVWWVSGRVRTLREHCCDDCAAQASRGSHTYARALAALEDWRSAAPFAPAASGGSLLARIRRITGQGEAPRPSLGWPAVAALAALLVLGACAAGSATQRPAEEAPVAPATPDRAAPPPPAPTALPAPPAPAAPLPARRGIVLRIDSLEDGEAWQQGAEDRQAWAEQWQAWGERWQEQMEDNPEWKAWQKDMQRWGDSLHAALPDSSSPRWKIFRVAPRVPAVPSLPKGLFEDMPDLPSRAAFPRGAVAVALDSLRWEKGDDLKELRARVGELRTRRDTFPEGNEAVVHFFRQGRAERQAERRALDRAAERLDASAEELGEKGRDEAARALREESRRLQQQIERLGDHEERLEEHRERLKKHRRQLERQRERLEEEQRERREEIEVREREYHEEARATQREAQREALRAQAAGLRAQADAQQEAVEGLRERVEALRGEEVPEERIEALRRRADALEEQVLTLRRRSRELRRQAGRLEREAGDDQMLEID